MAAAKIEISMILEQMEKCGYARVTQLDTQPQLTVQSERQTCLVNGQ